MRLGGEGVDSCSRIVAGKHYPHDELIFLHFEGDVCLPRDVCLAQCQKALSRVTMVQMLLSETVGSRR